jgi:hypothetical protein
MCGRFSNKAKAEAVAAEFELLDIPELEPRYNIAVPTSGQKSLHDFTVDVGEAEVASLVAEGEPLVPEAQYVQDRRIQVMHADGPFGDIEAEFVGRAIGDAGPSQGGAGPGRSAESPSHID